MAASNVFAVVNAAKGSVLDLYTVFVLYKHDKLKRVFIEHIERDHIDV